MSQSNPQVLKKIAPNIEDIKKLVSPDDSVLDVGCGHGYLSAHLGVENYTGIDLFEENVREARLAHPGRKFIRSDLFDLEGKWDVIICSRVLMHVPDYEKAVELLRSCCRKHLAVVIPIGQDALDVQQIGEGETLYFRVFPKERIEATNPEKIIEHEKYCTVIYGPNLP